MVYFPGVAFVKEAADGSADQFLVGPVEKPAVGLVDENTVALGIPTANQVPLVLDHRPVAGLALFPAAPPGFGFPMAVGVHQPAGGRDQRQNDKKKINELMVHYPPGKKDHPGLMPQTVRRRRFHQSLSRRLENRFGAVVDAQSLQKGGDMKFHGAFGEIEFGSDFLV